MRCPGCGASSNDFGVFLGHGQIYYLCCKVSHNYRTGSSERGKMNWVISSGMVEVEFDELLENRPTAIYIRVDNKKYWLPKSQVDFREWSNIVEVPEWLAKEKGLV